MTYHATADLYVWRPCPRHGEDDERPSTCACNADGEVRIDLTVAGTVNEDPGVWRTKNGDGCPASTEVADIEATGPDGRPFALTDDEYEAAADLLAEADPSYDGPDDRGDE